MRLGVIAENLLEWLARRGNAVPEPLLETQIAFSMARTIMAGVQLGVFEALGDGALDAAGVARACSTHAGATEKLLNALTACDYLRYRAGRYALTGKSTKWLLRRSPHNVCDKLLFQIHEWDTVAGYADYVRSGEALAMHQSIDAPDYWGDYQRGMRSLAGLAAGEVAARLPLPAGARDLLDIGGSHGYYSVCLCRRHAGLSSVILDLPEAVAQAAPILAQERMGDRVTHRAGNALTDDLGEAVADAVFMAQLVHHFDDAQNHAVMAKIARALRPGGICAILDAIRPATPGEGGQTGALLDLYFALTSASGTWPVASMHAWFSGAGLQPQATLWLRTMPQGALVIGRKPG